MFHLILLGYHLYLGLLFVLFAAIPQLFFCKKAEWMNVKRLDCQNVVSLGSRYMRIIPAFNEKKKESRKGKRVTIFMELPILSLVQIKEKMSTRIILHAGLD